MRHVFEDVSDVRQDRVFVVVACLSCGQQTSGEVPAESLASMTPLAKGVYVDEAECYDCLAKA